MSDEPQEEHSLGHKLALADSKRQLDEIKRHMQDTDQVVPVFVFEEVLKPYLDIRVDLPIEKREEIFQLWISKISATPTAPVRVVDDTGDTVAIVPPLINGESVHMSHEAFTELGKTIQTHGMKSVSMPEVADRELTAALDSTPVDIKDDHQDKWMELYSYFNLPIAKDDIGWIFVEDLVDPDGEDKKDDDKQDGGWRDDLMDSLFG